MRRILISLSSLIAVTAAFLSTATAAFAVHVNPPALDGGGGPAVPVTARTVVHHSSGLAPWQVAVIIVAGLLVLGATAIASRVVMGTRAGTASRRHLPTPAAG